MESKGRDGYYLPQIPTREEEEGKEGQESGPTTFVLLALIAAIFFASGALTCYLIYGLQH
jgi:hypothetical protein